MNWRRLAVPAVIVGSLLLANCGRPVENQQAPPSAALPEDVKLNNSMPLATYRKQLVEEAVLTPSIRGAVEIPFVVLRAGKTVATV